MLSSQNALLLRVELNRQRGQVLPFALQGLLSGRL